MARVKLLITDFDGTLVDTFEANFLAYQKAFADCGVDLTEIRYRDCFGLRFDDFMAHMGVSDMGTRSKIRKMKGDYYPLFFDKFKVNQILLHQIQAFKRSGGMTAVASTARKKNLMNALKFIGIEDSFSLVLAGEDVTHGKPDPEIYNKVLAELDVHPDEALVFEDSPAGIGAAEAAGIDYVKITSDYFYGNTSQGT